MGPACAPLAPRRPRALLPPAQCPAVLLTPQRHPRVVMGSLPSTPGPQVPLPVCTSHLKPSQKYGLPNNLIHQTHPPNRSKRLLMRRRRLRPAQSCLRGHSRPPGPALAPGCRHLQMGQEATLLALWVVTGRALRCAGQHEGCPGSTRADRRAWHRESGTQPVSRGVITTTAVSRAPLTYQL